jgi:biopolymer transport protein ExbD
MSRRSLRSEDQETAIDLSPMIDCIFILLIFFIVTTVFVEEQGVAVHKPDAAAASALETPEQVVLEIDQQSKIFVEGGEVSLADIPARVKAGMSDADTPVVIRAHSKSAHEVFVGVWDAARRGGAETLSFSTVN